MSNKKAREQYELILGDNTVAQPVNRVGRKSNGSVWYYLGFANQIGLSISLPLVLGAIGGGAVDLRMNSRPSFTLLGLLLGFIISIVNFYNIVKKIIRYSNKK